MFTWTRKRGMQTVVRQQDAVCYFTLTSSFICSVCTIFYQKKYFSRSPTPCRFNTRTSRLVRKLTLVRRSQTGSFPHAILCLLLHNRFVSHNSSSVDFNKCSVPSSAILRA